MARNDDEPKRPMGLRIPLSDYEYLTRVANRNDVDASHQVRRMIAYCRRHMPEDWLPSSEDDQSQAA